MVHIKLLRLIFCEINQCNVFETGSNNWRFYRSYPPALLEKEKNKTKKDERVE